MPSNQDQQDYQDYKDYQDYQAYHAQSNPSTYDSYVKPTLGLIGAAANTLDSYTGAPARAAVGAVENAPSLSAAPGAAWSAAKQQFGNTEQKAPSGADLLKNVGMPDKEIPTWMAGAGGWPVMAAKALGYHPTFPDVYGAGVEAAVNPMNAIPGLGEAKAAGEAVEAAPGIVGSAKNLVQSAVGRVGEELTGVNKTLTKNYFKNTDKINSMIASYGENAADHAADVRAAWNQAIQAKKNSLYNTVKADLAGAPKDTSIDVTPVVQKLEQSRDALNPVTHSDAIREIDNHIDTVKQLSQRNPGGVSKPSNPYEYSGEDLYHTNVQNLHEIKQYLQNAAKSSYKKNGEIFNSSPAAAGAAKGAGATSRQIFISEAPSTASGAEKQLSSLHDIEDSLNANLLNPTGQYNPLLRAGSNPGSMEARSLKELSKIVPHPFLQDATDFATAQTFRKAPLLPMDTTGKSLTRMLTAGAVGGAIGQFTPIGAREGMMIGAAAMSPAALKTGINAANMVGKGAKGLINAAPQASKGLLLNRPIMNGLINGQ